MKEEAEQAHREALAAWKRCAGPWWHRHHDAYIQYLALKRLGPDYGLYESKKLTDEMFEKFTRGLSLSE